MTTPLDTRELLFLFFLLQLLDKFDQNFYNEETLPLGTDKFVH